MSTPARRRLLAGLVVSVVAVVAAVVLTRRSTAIPQSPTVVLPLRCRLAGHGWKRPKPGQLPARRTCRRCEGLDLPNP